MRLNAKKAFTLVEMLIVIVIIGILAAALIPRLTGIQARARDVARKGDLQQISTALATFQLDNGVYITTGTLNTLTAFTGAVGPVGIALQGLVSGGLLKALPTEQQTSAMPYHYASYAAGQVFALASANEGGGVSANWTGATATDIAPFSGSATITTTSQITTQLCARVDLTAATIPSGCRANPTLNLAKYVISN